MISEQHLGWIMGLVWDVWLGGWLGYAVGRVFSQSRQIREMGERISQLEEDRMHLAAFCLTLARRLKDRPNDEELLEGERRVWQQLREYFREG